MTTQMFKKTILSGKVALIAVIAAVMAAVTIVPLFGVGPAGGTAIAAAVTPIIAGEPAIMVPGGQITGRVYILADGAITTEQPIMRTMQEVGGDAQAFTASVTILPARAITVNSEGRIVQIWSNAKVTTFGFFVLTTKSEETGQQIPLTQAIATQYNELRGTIEWGRAGKLLTVTPPAIGPSR